MATEPKAGMRGSPYAARPVVKAPPWHSLVSWDVFLNGLTTGLFLVATLGELSVPDVLAPAARAAYPTALIFLLADLVCLVLDLGDPLRFHHMLRVFKPTSPMSLGVWCLSAYSLPLTAVVALDLLPADWAPPGWVRTAVLVVGLVPALGSAVYKGVLFSTTSQAGWKDARWLGAYLTASALALGCAELLVVSLFTGPERAASLLRPALAVLLVVSAVPLGLLAADVRGGMPGVFSRGHLGLFAALAVVGGMVLPWFLLLGTSPYLLAGAAALVIAGGFAARHALVKLPHLIS
jgi:hypothetical protein